MGFTTALAGLAAVAGIGGLAAAGPALALPASTAAPVALTVASTSAAPSPSPSPASLCDDGAWRGPDGVNVEGRPDGLDAGDRGEVYLWHGTDGWHLRTTDISDAAHHYTGTVALSAGATFTSFAPVRLEHGDRVWVDGSNTLHYDFTTFNGIDGVNFTVSACDGARQHEVMAFSMDVNGHEDDASRIALGDAGQHPSTATFAVTRSV
jgi:hypothetical protein